MTNGIHALLAALRTGNSTAPRLTWYGPDGERIELSGRVLDNWVAKTSNFLVDELDAEPGTTVLLDMPAHWRSLSWALAAWQVGARLILPGADAGPSATDIVVTSNPEAAPAASATVAVALGALALRWPGELAADVVDFASEVRSHGDVFVPFSTPLTQDPAVSTAAGSHSYAELLSGFAAAGENSRLLVDARSGLTSSLRSALGAWSAGGSVVLVHESVEVTERLLADERVTSRS